MYGNPYFAQQQQRFQQPMINQPTQPQPYIPTIQPINNPTSLLGKAVESVDVVKAMDIPFDGSISYFPLTDGSAIITKQLQTDGTSKMVVYKPVQEDKKDAIQFATLEDIENAINDLDLSDIQDLRDDVKEIKKQLKEFKTKKSKDE
jgi:hypothetical protein